MVQIQIKLSEEENKIVTICKVMQNFQTKEEAVKYIIKMYKRSESNDRQNKHSDVRSTA